MSIDLEIVSPEKLLLSKSADMVVIPAAEGEMGVLPGHAPMIVLLRGGTIKLTVGGTVTEVNSALNDAPDTINTAANETWIIKLKVSDAGPADSLLDAAAYEKFVAEETGH